MTRILNLTGAAYAASGAASAGSTGLNTITGGTHVGSTDIPVGSISSGYITGAEGAALSIRHQATTVPFSGGETDYWVRFWLRINENNTVFSDGQQPPGSFVTFHLATAGSATKLAMYFGHRNDTAMKGVTPFTSTFSLGTAGTTEHLDGLGASGGPPVIPYNTWVEFTYHIKYAAGAGGTFEFFVNRCLVGGTTGCSTTDADHSTAGAVNFNFTFPAIAGITYQVCPPFESWTGTDIPCRPMDTTFDTSSNNLYKPYICTFANRSKGGHWNVTGTGTMTSTTYSSSGVSPVRKRFVLSGSSTQTGIMTTIDDVGTLPFNEYGIATLVFPMLYAPSGGAVSIVIKDSGGSTLKTINVTSSELREDSTKLTDWNHANRYQLLLHFSSSGTATWTLLDLTTDLTQAITWSGNLTNWTPQAIGSVVITGTRGSANMEMDGMYVMRWAEILGIDSMLHANVTTLSPNMAWVNHSAAYLPYCGDTQSIAGAFWLRRSDGLPRTTMCGITGRSGRKRSEWQTYAFPGLAYSRGIRIVSIDGGSINDFNSSAITDATSRDVAVASVVGNLQTLVAWAISTRNKVWLTTMISRIQGTYSSFQLQAIDAYNREILRIARQYQSHNLIQVSDVSGAITDQLQLYQGMSVSGANGGPYTVTFRNFGNVAEMTLNNNSLTGGSSPNVVIATTQAGVAGVNGGYGTDEIQTVTITGSPTGGTFRLAFNSVASGTIAYNASAATVRAAIIAIAQSTNVNDDVHPSIPGDKQMAIKMVTQMRGYPLASGSGRSVNYDVAKQSFMIAHTPSPTRNSSTDELKWLRQETDRTYGAIDDLWMNYLAMQGFTNGAVEDRQTQWLKSKGYSGSLRDMLRDFYYDNS